MAVMDLVIYPRAPLMKRAAPLTDIGRAEAKLVADMMETMRAYEGIGLAAPQVGLARRIIVFQEPEGRSGCLLNPEIVSSDGLESAEEGCLSLPHLYAMVPRATRIHARGLNEQGEPVDLEAMGLLARIIQHETDHLDGVILFDRLDVLTRQVKLQEWEAIRERMAEAIREG